MGLLNSRSPRVKTVGRLAVLVGWILSVHGTAEELTRGSKRPNSQERVQESQPSDDLLDMSLEQLMEVEVVVSGSRREQSLHQSSVPIRVVDTVSSVMNIITQQPYDTPAAFLGTPWNPLGDSYPLVHCRVGKGPWN